LCDLPQYANGLIILKKDDSQFTLASKKPLHITVKSQGSLLAVADRPARRSTSAKISTA